MAAFVAFTPHVILYLHAEFRRNWTIGDRVMTSNQIFKMAAMESEIFSG